MKPMIEYMIFDVTNPDDPILSERIPEDDADDIELFENEVLVKMVEDVSYRVTGPRA